MSATASYRIIVTISAQRSINELEAPVKMRVLARINTLAANPRPHGVKKLQGVDSYRVRVGDYRIIYAVEDVVRLITVTRVGHRRDVYR